ncbi:hypothetical protein [Dinoroseobacter sp. S124A]|uniref:hypothetical protein n=1 Tax=Dinoroseobacter sp. S124A TaxID=3415128 RepID=UPI003C7DC2DB
MADEDRDGAVLAARGWQVFPPEPAVADWLTHIRPLALSLAADPALRAAWLRHGGTWFAGVNLLPNDGAGRLGGGPPLAGRALDVAQNLAGELPLDRAQISVTYPGYPRRDPAESEAAHGFRLRRDAAHLDGLLPVGPERRRFIAEPAAFVLGYPLTEADPGASPLVVWEGSHHVLRPALRRVMATLPPAEWRTRDVTEVYAAARREVFARCRRVPVHAPPGSAILLHRLTLHGVAPWQDGAQADPAGRAIAYFRPDLPGGAEAWLADP